MKAIIFEQYGPPEVFKLVELEQPKPSKDQVLIRIHAAEATKGDCELRSFRFPVKWFSFGLRLMIGVFKPRKRILGGYFAGEVVAVGEGVDKFTPGDQLFGTSKLKMGAYAQYLVLFQNYTLVAKPENLSFEEAAALPLGALNALHFLRLAKLQAGENILINGAGGSIGLYAIQIAIDMGAEVIAVDHPSKKDMLLKLGIKEFIDYTQIDFRRGDQKYSVIFDAVASSPLDESIQTLKSGGRYITTNPTVKKMWNASRIFKETGKQVIFAFAEEGEEELKTIKTMAETNRLRPVIDKVFSMAQVAEAHRRVETEARQGVVVIKMD
jgi:NADPH:quinone reductase-like Zn-dependent oxidoreductase